MARFKLAVGKLAYDLHALQMVVGLDTGPELGDVIFECSQGRSRVVRNSEQIVDGDCDGLGCGAGCDCDWPGMRSSVRPYHAKLLGHEADMADKGVAFVCAQSSRGYSTTERNGVRKSHF